MQVTNKALQRYLDLTTQYRKDVLELVEDPELQDLPPAIKMSIGLVPVAQELSNKLFLDLVKNSGIALVHEEIT